jgi:repressor LexA
MKKITAKQLLVLDFIKEFSYDNGFSPTIKEIADFFSITNRAVQDHLLALEKKGYITKENNKGRTININKDITEFESQNSEIFFQKKSYENSNIVNVPLLGQVAAGVPILAAQNIEDYIPMPKDFVKGYNVFALVVKGNSMIEKGIFSDDVIFVKEQAYANDGDVIVALIDDEVTVKTFYKRKDIVELKPENSSMNSIFVKDVVILGKVIGLNRRVIN